MNKATTQGLKEVRAAIANQAQAKRFLQTIGLHPTSVSRNEDDYVSFNLARDVREDEIVTMIGNAVSRAPVKRVKDFGPAGHKITKTLEWMWTISGKGVIVFYPALMRVGFANRPESVVEAAAVNLPKRKLYAVNDYKEWCLDCKANLLKIRKLITKNFVQFTAYNGGSVVGTFASNVGGVLNLYLIDLDSPVFFRKNGQSHDGTLILMIDGNAMVESETDIVKIPLKDIHFDRSFASVDANNCGTTEMSTASPKVGSEEWFLGLDHAKQKDYLAKNPTSKHAKIHKAKRKLKNSAKKGMTTKAKKKAMTGLTTRTGLSTAAVSRLKTIKQKAKKIL